MNKKIQAIASYVSVGFLLIALIVGVQYVQKPTRSARSFASVPTPTPSLVQPDYLNEKHTKYLPQIKPQTETSVATTETIPALPDLDVTYISRTPRYYRYCVQYANDIPSLCPGTETQKRWPATGETLTYEAHIRNKGQSFNGTVRYDWSVDGVVKKTGTIAVSLGSNAEKTFVYQTTFPAQNQIITFSTQRADSGTEISTLNNTLTIGSHDLTLSYWVEDALYKLFNASKNTLGTYSFEDWVRVHIQAFNDRLRQSQYPQALQGVYDQVHIDKIVIAPELDGPLSPRNTDPDLYTIDGRWQTTDFDPTNQNGINGFNQQYTSQFIGQIDWGLIHELGHQLGAPDLYHMRLPINVPNNGIQVISLYNKPVTKIQLPNNGEATPYFDLMGGGDIRPHTDHTYFSSHTVLGLNSNRGKRRGYFAEYYYDTPTTTQLLVKDATNTVMGTAQVQLFQRNPQTELFDNIPEFSGTTNAVGIVVLSNRPVTAVTTATGHTLKPNPFGQINVVGTNGTMIAKVTKNGQEGYGFFQLHDVNLAYWKGQTSTATIETATTYLPISSFNLISPINNVVVNANSVTLSWNPASGATSYGWQVMPEGFTAYQSVGSTSATSVTVPLKAGNYTWKVTAKNVVNTKLSNLGFFAVPLTKIQPLSGTQIPYGSTYTFKWRPLHPLYEQFYFLIYSSTNTQTPIYYKLIQSHMTEYQIGKLTLLLSSTTNAGFVKGKSYTWQLIVSNGTGFTPPVDSTSIPQSFTLQ